MRYTSKRRAISIHKAVTDSGKAMESHLGTERLKSSETMASFNVVAPDGKYGLDLVDFIYDRGLFDADSS